MGRRRQQPATAAARSVPRAPLADEADDYDHDDHDDQAAPAPGLPADEEDDSMDVDIVYVKLKSSDGKYFNFTESEASCSNALKRMLESSRQHCANDSQSERHGGRSNCDCIHLQSIDSKVLTNIQQWCKMHSLNQSSVSAWRRRSDSDSLTGDCGSGGQEDEQAEDTVAGVEPGWGRNLDEDEPDVGQRRDTSVSWQMRYLASFSELDLLKLASAANFLDISLLYDSCCKYMARKWEGMKVEEIRRAYKIRDDFAADEEVAIIQENKRIGLSE